MAGIREELVVEPDGRARFSEGRFTESPGDRRTFRLTVDELRELRNVLQSAGIQDLDSQYGEVRPDGIGQTVTYRGRTVSVAGGDGPSELDPVLRLLTRLSDGALG